MPNYFHIGPIVFVQKIFKVFPFGCHDNQHFAWTGRHLTTLKVDHPRSPTPVKMCDIPPSGLGGDVI